MEVTLIVLRLLKIYFHTKNFKNHSEYEILLVDYHNPNDGKELEKNIKRI